LPPFPSVLSFFFLFLTNPLGGLPPVLRGPDPYVYPLCARREDLELPEVNSMHPVHLHPPTSFCNFPPFFWFADLSLHFFPPPPFKTGVCYKPISRSFCFYPFVDTPPPPLGHLLSQSSLRLCLFFKSPSRFAAVTGENPFPPPHQKPTPFRVSLFPPSLVSKNVGWSPLLSPFF